METPAPSATPAGAWQQLETMRVPRSEMSAAYLDGRIYVPGGFQDGDPAFGTTDTLEAYDIAAGEWLMLAAMPEARHHLMAVAHEGSLYVFGGAGGPAFNALNNTWHYDPATDSWHVLAAMPENRLGGAAVALDGFLYVVGGTGGSPALLRYDPATDSWATLAPLRRAREHHAAVVLEGQIYALGGRWEGTTSTVESYDPATDSWTARNGMRQNRAGFGAGVIDGRIIVAGGEVIEGAPFSLDSIEVYEAETRSWALLEMTLPAPLHGFPIVVVDDALYVVGGSGLAAAIANRGDLFVTEAFAGD